MADAFISGAHTALWVCGFITAFILGILTIGLAFKFVDWLFMPRDKRGKK